MTIDALVIDTIDRQAAHIDELRAKLAATEAQRDAALAACRLALAYHGPCREFNALAKEMGLIVGKYETIATVKRVIESAVALTPRAIRWGDRGANQ